MICACGWAGDEADFELHTCLAEQSEEREPWPTEPDPLEPVDRLFSGIAGLAADPPTYGLMTGPEAQAWADEWRGW